MTEKNKDIHHVMANPENDREFKLHVLKKLDIVHDATVKSKQEAKYFKLQIMALVVVITGAKEALIKFLNIH